MAVFPTVQVSIRPYRVGMKLTALTVLALTLALAGAAAVGAGASGSDITPVTPPVAKSTMWQPVVAITKPSPLIKRTGSGATLTYTLKKGKPVTWHYRVAEGSGQYVYSITVYKGATSTKVVDGTGSQFKYSQKVTQTSWTWAKPKAGRYHVCVSAIDMGGTDNLNDWVCQSLLVQ